MPKNFRNLVVIESAYKPFSHYPALTQALHNVSRERGLTYLGLYPATARFRPDSNPDWFRSVLPTKPEPYTPLRRLGYFLRFLKTVLTYPYPSNTVFFWPTALPEEVAASFLMAITRGKVGSHVVVSHMACRTARQRWLSPGIWSLRLAYLTKKLVPSLPWTALAASSPYQRDLKDILVHLPIVPMTVFNPIKAHPPLEGPECRIVMAGQPRSVKGFPLLVECLYQLKDWLQEGRVSITLQIGGALEEDEKTQAAYSRLLECPLPNVHLIDSFLDEAQYENLLREGHFGLLPYDPEHYAYYPSAVMHDWLAAARPLITCRGTLSAEEIQRTGAGILCDYSVESLKGALRQACELRDHYLERAAEVRAQWLGQHSKESLLNTILERADSPL